MGILDLRWALLLIGVSACAHQANVSPIPPAQQDAYFTCPPARSLDEAEEGLARAGYLIRSRGETYVQTDWMGISYDKQNLAEALGVTGFRLRVVATVNSDQVRFRIWSAAETTSRNVVLGTVQRGTRESEWSPITEAQASDKTSRRILADVREAVCGDRKLPFKAPRRKKSKQRRQRKSSGDSFTY